METSIDIDEVVQAGDVFLLHFDCPWCEAQNFSTIPLDACTKCLTGFGSYCLNLPVHRRDFRLLAGSRRKRLPFRKRTIATLMEIQNRECAYCDCSLMKEQFHIDHVIPISVGGSNKFANLVLACAPCNLTASSKVFDSFMAKRLYLQSERRIGTRPAPEIAILDDRASEYSNLSTGN